MSAKPCNYCDHNKTLHKWDCRERRCMVDACGCSEYVPPRVYDQCSRCNSTKSYSHHCDLEIEMMKLRGMIWWLASDLAADDGDPTSTPETWVALAEQHWRLGLRFEARRIQAAS